MKLYHAAQSRSTRPRWLLEEIGEPYDIVRLDLAKGENKSAEYLKIHPHGAVPALIDGELVMFESAAICAYLADKFPDKRLAPAVGTAARGRYYQWLVYCMATLEPPVLQVFLHGNRLPEAERSAKLLEEGKKKFAEVATVLNNAVRGKSFLLGDQFSAADVMIGSTLAWARAMGLVNGYPELEAYIQRVVERPAYKRARAD
jgi:glutathione S-transferase